MIFCQQISLSMMPPPGALFRTYLDRWLRLWQQRVRPGRAVSSPGALFDSHVQAAGLGFVRHAIEYHSLALAKLDVLFDDSKTSGFETPSIGSGNLVGLIHAAVRLRCNEPYSQAS